MSLTGPEPEVAAWRKAGHLARVNLSLFARHPRQLRHGARWLRSLGSSEDPLASRRPWLTYDAVAWLDAHMPGIHRVFEYGSGGSTLYFIEQVDRLVSVEHDRAWHNRVTRATRSLGGSCRADLLLVEPEPAPPGAAWSYGPDAATSAQPGHRQERYGAYVRAIEDYEDEEFDLLLVDGRSRVACVRRGLGFVAEGGYLMLDNAERPRYGVVNELLAGMERWTLEGPVPGASRPSRTLVWRLRGTVR